MFSELCSVCSGTKECQDVHHSMIKYVASGEFVSGGGPCRACGKPPDQPGKCSACHGTGRDLNSSSRTSSEEELKSRQQPRNHREPENDALGTSGEIPLEVYISSLSKYLVVSAATGVAAYLAGGLESGKLIGDLSNDPGARIFFGVVFGLGWPLVAFLGLFTSIFGQDEEMALLSKGVLWGIGLLSLLTFVGWVARRSKS